MKKRAKKLALNRETLRHLQASSLHQVWGASASCPLECETSATCPGTTAQCTNTCGCATWEYSCTCPPASFPDSRCLACE
jgi:hypothetical protein